jgi:iron complex outermembrane receptor protein
MMNYEIGWTQNWLHYKMKTELTLYLCNGENMIILVPPAAPPPPIYKNTGSFSNQGIEFSWDYQPLEKLRLHTNYSFIGMKTPLPATPEHNLYLAGTWLFRKFQFNLKIQNIFNLYNQDETGNSSIVEKNYHLLGARIGYRINKYINIFINGNNMLNQEYQINKGYPMPGITVFGGVNLKFDKE